MELPTGIRFPNASSKIDRYRGEIFRQYIVEKKTAIEVRNQLKLCFDLDVSPMVFKKKVGQWGYAKNIKRSDLLKIMRDEKKSEEEPEDLLLVHQQRPLDRERVEKHAQRALPPSLRAVFASKLTQRSKNNNLLALDSASLPQSLPVFQAWKLPEKLLRDVDILIKGSFESGRWSFNGSSQIIKSSIKPEVQVFEVQSLHEFLSDLDKGCNASDVSNFELAGVHWKRAFLTLEVLVKGQYHDIIPNIIQKINDLSRQGKIDLAALLKEHTANCCRKFLASNSSTFSIYSNLGNLEMSLMLEIEERLMRRYCELFEFYLGPLAYNSFVVVIDAARRRLLQNPWTTFDDCLPAISYLDNNFGPLDRRCLDIIGMRAEILTQRKMFKEVEIEALLLTQRADMIQNDQWQRFYHLTRGWYFLGNAEYFLKKTDMAIASLRHCLWYERKLAEVHDFHIFGAEKATIAKHLEQMGAAAAEGSPKDQACGAEDA